MDAHYAFNCAVRDLTPRCMHWITVLINVVLPNIQRTKEEIRTGKVRPYKARMCIVAQDPGQMQTLVVDDHVLLWYRNRFYRANHFAAAYAVLLIADRFEMLSDANTTFQSLALSKQDVYADILSYVHDILRPLTEAVDTEGGSRPLPATKQPNPEYTRSTRPGYGSRSNSRLHAAGVERLLQPVDRPRVGGSAPSEPGTSVPGPSIYHQGYR